MLGGGGCCCRDSALTGGSSNIYVATSIGRLCIKQGHKSLTSSLHQGLSSRNSLPTPQPRRSSASSSCSALPSLDSASARWERNSGKRPHPDLNLSR